MSTGYGFHGDFLNGWDPQTLKAGIEQCAVANVDGVVHECPVFAPIDEDNSKLPEYCPALKPEIAEPVHGMIDKLPGCINVTPGPADAKLSDFVCPAGAQQPKVFYA